MVNRSIVNKPFQGLVHQYLCAPRHPHHGGHERVRQEMDGCVAATQEYPGTIHPKYFPTLGGLVNLDSIAVTVFVNIG